MNAVDRRWIMYCGSEKLYQTISYTPLVTTGSIAAPPSALAFTTASKDPSATSKTATSAMDTASLNAPIDSKISHTTVPKAAPGDFSAGFSRQMVIGISVGSVAASVAIMALILLLMRKRRQSMNRKSNMGSAVLSSTSRSTATDSSASEGHQLPEHPTSPFRITPAKAHRLSTEQDRRVHEMEATHLSSPLTANGRFSPSGPPPNWNAPSPGLNNPGTNMSGGHNSTAYIPYRPGLTISHIGSQTSELSSIRHVRPSGSYRDSSTEPSSISSPQGNSYIVSPLLGSESHTPLMDQWGSGDNASVGKRSPHPSATVSGPVNWPSPVHNKSTSRPDNGHGVRRSLTNATGGGSKWISPESALAHGFLAGDDEDHEEAENTRGISK